MASFWDLFRRSPPEPSAQPQARFDPADYANITTSQDLAEFLANGSETFAGETVGPREAMKVAAVFRCVNIRADVAASAPIHIKDKVTFERRGVEDDLVFLLNDRPNSRQSAFTLRRVMEVQKLLRGDAFARVVRGVGNRPIALEFMSYDRTTVEELPDRSLEYRYAAKSGRTITLQQSDVLHVMGPSYDGVRGMSVLEYARNQIGLSVASEKHASSLFKNGTNIGDIIKSENMLSDEAVEFLKESLEVYRGAENGNRTLILQGGLGYEKLGMTQADAEFVLSRKLGVIELCMFFGVPPHIVGFNEGQIYGNGVEHTGIAFVNFTLNGEFSGWEAALRQTFLGENRREMIEIDDSMLLRGDINTRWASYKTGVEIGALSANDVNRLERRPDVPNGDTYWTQPNLARGQENEPTRPSED